jgi:hypothetical protein
LKGRDGGQGHGLLVCEDINPAETPVVRDHLPTLARECRQT